jgi:hypothetical protein
MDRQRIQILDVPAIIAGINRWGDARKDLSSDNVHGIVQTSPLPRPPAVVTIGRIGKSID